MSQKKDPRLVALWRFAISITLFNVLGHAFFGFEQSFAQPLVALATAYSMEILLELIDARSNRRPLRFAGGFRPLVNFLLSAHITALAVAMLLYANERLLPIVFATAVAIGSKAIFRAPVGNGTRHFLNPSNFGITVTLLLFPWVGIAPPYHFTENLSGLADWILPGLLVASGTLLNVNLTKKGPLILGWLGGFAGQAVLRNLLFDTPLIAALLPMTGVAFLLFTFYMITDPGTTPFKPRNQIIFGVAVAVLYGFLVTVHVVFGLFFALTTVSTVRGLCLYAHAFAERRARSKGEVPASAVAGRAGS